MPFGIGLPDIIEEPLNRVPGVGSLIETDEEKRRKRRRKKKRPTTVPKTRKKEEKKDDDRPDSLGEALKHFITPGAMFEDVASPVLKAVRAPKIVRNVPKNIAELGAGLVPAAGVFARAGWHDIRHPDMPSDNDIGDFLRLAKWTLADEKGDKKKRPKTDSEMMGLVAEMLRGWGRGIERAVPDVTNKRDIQEARTAWTEQPVFSLLDVLPVGTAITRPASVARHARSIAAANPELTGAQAARMGVKESYRPGAARRAGLEGGIPERRHEVQIGDETRSVVGRPYSRNPLMREGQRAYDAIFELSPSLQTRRVGRVEERAQGEVRRQITLATQELSAPVARVVYGRVGRTMGAFGFRSKMTAAERSRATALAYVFQMPKNMDFDAALAAVQDDLTQILEEGKMEVPRGRRVKQIDLTKEQRQALTTQVADIQRARRELDSGEISHEEFQGALEAMGQMSDKVQEMGLDIMARRYGLDEEEMGELGAAWGNRATILPRRLAARGHMGMELADSPEREAWLRVLSEQLGEEEARNSIAFSDALARGVRPNDPASFYTDRVGMPSGESAAEFGARVQEGALYQALDSFDNLTEFGVSTARASGFYSPLQKWVDESMPDKPIPKEVLREELHGRIPDEEFYNVGLDNFFNDLPEGAEVTKPQFQAFLANPMNAYNLRITHRVNTQEAAEAGYGTRYDFEQQGNYVSRDAAPGEYHEVTMELPGTGRDIDYGRTGNGHWEKDNVVVHFRFHVFMEDGKTKMLVEEIQSDWVGDFLKQTKKGQRYEPHTDITSDELVWLDDDIRIGEYQMADYRREELALNQRIREATESKDWEARSDAEREWYDLQDKKDTLQERLTEQRMIYEQASSQGQIPPPPLGKKTKADGLTASSYVNAPVRWMLRHADETGVDEVILVSREAQLLRNARIRPDVWHANREAGAEAITQHFKDNPDTGPSYRSYGPGKDIAKTIEREMGGVKGEGVDDAYSGSYRYAMDYENDGWGRMPGTVFKMNDEARRIARLPKSYYQRQPNWKGIPKGANEILSGRNLVHIFEQGDVSTWIHELGHSALFDLHADDLRVIEGQLAGGRKLADWTDMDHETFARAFEDYVRRGRAPNQQLASVFQKLSTWVRAIWQQSKQKGIKTEPEVREVFDKMFKPPDASDHLPWGYLPHRDFTELAQQDYRGGVRPPAAGQTIGVPRLTGETVQRGENELLLYQSGRLSPDPAQLVDVFLRRTRFQETLNARDELWAMGQSLDEKPPRGAWLIRNPDEAAERIRSDVQAAVRGRDTTLPLERGDLEALEGRLTGQADDIRREMIARPGEHPEWASDMENVRWVPGEYVETRFGEVFEQRPRGRLWSALGMMNSLQRTTGIYGRPISYIGGNVPFNTMALMASMPVSTLRNAGRTIRMMKENPERYRRIASETGETRASGGLPDFYVQAQNRMQAAEQRATTAQRAGADILSKAADTPFRVTAFLNNAAKRGYKTGEELDDLLASGGSDLSDIRQLTREQLLDFDALNPSQRRLASQFLYLWPFIYASVKWPAMFAREYPARAAFAAQAAEQQEKGIPQSIANLWQEQGIDLSTLNPIGPVGEISEQLQALLEDPTRMDLTVLQDRLSPTLAAMVEGMAGGSKNALQNIVRQTVPGAAEFMSEDPRFRGGKQYADQDREAYLLQRHTRFWPRGVNPEVIKERVEQFRKDQISGDTHELERNADWEKIADYYAKVGGDGEAIKASYKAWWDYQEAVDQKKESTGQRKLTAIQTIEILDEVARENFPEVVPELWDVEKMRDPAYQEKYAEQMDEYAETLKEYINRGRTQLFDDYRSYAAP